MKGVETMLPLYFIAKPVLWVLPWLLQSIGYAGILNKAGEKRAWALFPVLAEWRLSRLLFKDIRSFVHPLIVTCVLLGFRFYYSPVGSSVPDFLTMNVVLFGMAAAVVYGLFLIRFYYRLGRAFGKGVPYSIALTIFPLILLIHLGYSKAVFTKPVFPESKIINTPWKRHLYNFVRMLGMVALVAAIVAGSGYYTLQTYPPRLYVEYDILRGFRDASKQVPAEGKIITREEMMGDAYANLAAMPTSRDKFFPDHSKDEKVVILQYAVGSNLEASYGLLSANLSDQLKATESTDDLTIVTQAGGSTRWFTKGIEDRSVGRYTIQSGEIKKVQSLDPETGMSDPKSFRDFLSWAVKEYPADRYMLFLWDHGGGFTTGYGQDVLNPRTSNENPYGTLTTHDIVKAVEKTGTKFDLIGFDACLMQDIEVGYVLEPYADYYLASEETEGGFGWCYSHGIKA
ncbi:MAG: hypothetical protein J6D18_00715, partial [Erysipelotrichaceae bacterium]|nr:hypothetical protein [Erysipelotrichaceae bacterium]